MLQLSEISIPSILAESIFAAQSGDAVVFYRNSKILAFLCISSGICRSVLIFTLIAESENILFFVCTRVGCFVI